MLVCGCCDGHCTIATIVAPDRYDYATRPLGRHQRQAIEERVLAGLKDRLLTPEMIAAFVGAFNAEIRRQSGEAEAERAAAKRALADIERKIAGIVRAIEDGAYNPTLTEHLTTLEREKATATAKLDTVATVTPVRLLPNLPDVDARKVALLTEALNNPKTAPQAGDDIRSLIDRVVLTPAEDGMRAERFGDLAKITAMAAEAKMTNPGAAGAGPGLLSVVDHRMRQNEHRAGAIVSGTSIASEKDQSAAGFP